MRPAEPERIAIMSAAELSTEVERLGQLIAQEQGDGRALAVLRLRGAPLSSRGFNSSELRELQRAISRHREEEVAPDEAAATYDRHMAALLSEILAHCPMEASIYGLPLEGHNAGPANRRLDEVIGALDFLVSSKRIVMVDTGMSENAMAALALPHALAARGERALFFQTNGIWRVIDGQKRHLADVQVDRTSWSSVSAGDRQVARLDYQSGQGRSSDGGSDVGNDGGGENDPPDGGDNRRASFEVHWSVRGDFASELELGDLPVQRDVALFYASELGLHPWVRDGDVRNGGMPQSMDLALHLARMTAGIDRMIPDPDFAGYAVIDYEEFPFYWRILSEGYKTFARNLVRVRHPGLPDDEVEAMARSEYEDGIRTFYLETLRRAKELRPHAKWGYFLNTFVFAQNESPESLDWLWAEVDAMYPTTYIGKYGIARHEDLDNEWQAYASGTRARLAMRLQQCRELMGEGKFVLPFVAWRYHGVNDLYGMQPLNDLDLDTELMVGYENDADGIIVWDKLHTAQDAAQLQNQLDQRVGPAIRQLMQNRGG